jgi:hypothetical protein
MPTSIGNFFMRAIICSPLHALLGDNLAVITVRGHKSGKQYSTPINVTQQNGDWVVVSLRSGQTARLHVAGKDQVVQGKVIEEHAAVVTGLADYFRRNPSYAKYYGIHLAAEGQPDMTELTRVADERILIRLTPT